MEIDLFNAGASSTTAQFLHSIPEHIKTRWFYFTDLVKWFVKYKPVFESLFAGTYKWGLLDQREVWNRLKNVWIVLYRSYLDFPHALLIPLAISWHRDPPLDYATIERISHSVWRGQLHWQRASQLNCNASIPWQAHRSKLHEQRQVHSRVSEKDSCQAQQHGDKVDGNLVCTDQHTIGQSTWNTLSA